MDKRTIVFFGDSNTYGYEPSEVMPGRYPAEVRWTDRLSSLFLDSWEIVPRGLNGRRIPDVRYGYEQETVLRMIAESGPSGYLCVMLGTNDIVLTGMPDADLPVRKMDRLLAFLTGRKEAGRLLITAPPCIGHAASEPGTMLRRCYDECQAMNQAFGILAEHYGVHFADAGAWDIPLAFDFVHLSEAGHARFAECMAEVLKGL